MRPRRGRRAAPDRLRRCHRAGRRRAQRELERHPYVPDPLTIRLSSFFPLRARLARSDLVVDIPAPPTTRPLQASRAPPRTCTASTCVAACGVSSRLPARAPLPAPRTPPRRWATWWWFRAASGPPVWLRKICMCSTCRGRRGGTASWCAAPAPVRGTRTSSPSSRRGSWWCTAGTTAASPWATAGAWTPPTSRTSGSR